MSTDIACIGIVDIRSAKQSILVVTMELGRQHHQFRVVNVVCTMELGRPINLMLSCMVTHGKLGMGVFPAHVSKCRFPHSTNCSFETGKLVNTGSINVVSALLGARSFIDRLTRDIGYELEIWNFAVQNIVGAVKVGFRLNLNLFFDDRIKEGDLICKWEPGMFPGLLFETSEDDIVFILFESGNIIATGPCDINRITKAEELLYDLNIERYAVGHEYRSLDGVQIIAEERTESKKTKKPNQFKVISHTKKREEFKATMLNDSTKKKNTKRKPAPDRAETSNNRKRKTSTTSSVQYKHL